MAKRFDIHEWQAKQRKKSLLTENTGYDAVIQRYLDQIVDDVIGPGITKEEAIKYIDELSQAILNLKTTIIPDIFNVKQEHHEEEDFPGKDLSAWDLLDKLKSGDKELYDRVEDFMKQMDEASMTGTGASFQAGSGEGYMTPNAFGKKKNKKN